LYAKYTKRTKKVAGPLKLTDNLACVDKEKPTWGCKPRILQKHMSIPFLSLVGQNGDYQIGSSPGFGSLLTQTFPEHSFQWYILSSLPITVA